MNILIVGSGGREHALAWKLSQCVGVGTVFCAPGNPGIATVATCVDLPATNIKELLTFAREHEIGLTIVGPEVPLVAGIVDEFESAGLKIFGPTKRAAELEGSKSFAKELMKKYNIPTARSEVFGNVDNARAYCSTCPIPIVIKADGLAAGKGVTVARTRQEALDAISRMMSDKEFGESGSTVVVEEYLEGQEVSVLCLTDGRQFRTLPSAQDHKTIFNNDQGPNTGGMGAFAPVPWMTPELLGRIEQEILRPTIDGMANEGRTYSGVLYAGLMMTNAGPKVIEFNCRFGDPETQAILPLVESDLLDAMIRIANGDLGDYQLQVSNRFTVSVVLASAGYPGEYEKGKPIEILNSNHNPNTMLFHAGTTLDGQGRVVTSGGRVLSITALGNTLAEAQQKAYESVNQVRFDGMQYRTDIGAKAI